MNPVNWIPDVWKTAPLPELRGSVLQVAMALARFINDQNICWPGRKRISDLTGLSTETIRRAIRWLEEHRWLSTTLPTDDRPSCTYRLLCPLGDGVTAKIAPSSPRNRVAPPHKTVDQTSSIEPHPATTTPTITNPPADDAASARGRRGEASGGGREMQDVQSPHGDTWQARAQRLVAMGITPQQAKVLSQLPGVDQKRIDDVIYNHDELRKRNRMRSSAGYIANAIRNGWPRIGCVTTRPAPVQESETIRKERQNQQQLRQSLAQREAQIDQLLSTIEPDELERLRQTWLATVSDVLREQFKTRDARKISTFRFWLLDSSAQKQG